MLTFHLNEAMSPGYYSTQQKQDCEFIVSSHFDFAQISRNWFPSHFTSKTLLKILVPSGPEKIKNILKILQFVV